MPPSAVARIHAWQPSLMWFEARNSATDTSRVARIPTRCWKNAPPSFARSSHEQSAMNGANQSRPRSWRPVKCAAHPVPSMRNSAGALR